MEDFGVVVGGGLMLLVAYLVIKPGDPASKEPNIQVGRFVGTNVSKSGIFWFYSAIFAFVVVATVFNALTK